MRSRSTPGDNHPEIVDALNTLWDIVGHSHPGRDDPAGLQQLIDHFLDVRPAFTLVELEHRLLMLAAALQDLGPWTADGEVVADANRRSQQLH